MFRSDTGSLQAAKESNGIKKDRARDRHVVFEKFNMTFEHMINQLMHMNM
jgi:hypothetical protein